MESHLLQMRGLKRDGILRNKVMRLSRIFYRCVD